MREKADRLYIIEISCYRQNRGKTPLNISGGVLGIKEVWNMVIKSVNLETVCGVTSKLPENKFMEIAFSGKSNVGKSSLINGLMNRKSLARTSSKPGKTQTINYYNVNDEMYFVDLPGYGYATANV